MIGVLSIYFNKPYSFPSFKTPKVEAAAVQAFLGTYASATFPFKITLSYEDGVFKAQATGQGAFPLEAAGKRIYIFKQAGIKMTFSSAGDSFVLQQGAGSYRFTRWVTK